MCEEEDDNLNTHQLGVVRSYIQKEIDLGASEHFKILSGGRTPPYEQVNQSKDSFKQPFIS